MDRDFLPVNLKLRLEFTKMACQASEQILKLKNEFDSVEREVLTRAGTKNAPLNLKDSLKMIEAE